jgi:hypothetical protein
MNDTPPSIAPETLQLLAHLSEYSLSLKKLSHYVVSMSN